MEFGPSSYALSYAAGLLSTLSPCVLPIIPILLATAVKAHPRAALALAGGLALSYAIVGTAIAALGGAVGVQGAAFKTAGALLLGAIGLVLLSSTLQERFARLSARAGDAGNVLLSTLSIDGLWGQFLVGLLLGIVWSPCVGPTLGAAALVASQGSHTVEVAAMMAVFGLGAASPVIVLGHLSQRLLGKTRMRLLKAGKAGKMTMGAAMLGVSMLLVSGYDKAFETAVVAASPDWLIALTSTL